MLFEHCDVITDNCCVMEDEQQQQQQQQQHHEQKQRIQGQNLYQSSRLVQEQPLQQHQKQQQQQQLLQSPFFERQQQQLRLVGCQQHHHHVMKHQLFHQFLEQSCSYIQPEECNPIQHNQRGTSSVTSYTTSCCDNVMTSRRSEYRQERVMTSQTEVCSNNDVIIKCEYNDVTLSPPSCRYASRDRQLTPHWSDQNRATWEFTPDWSDCSGVTSCEHTVNEQTISDVDPIWPPFYSPPSQRCATTLLSPPSPVSLHPRALFKQYITPPSSLGSIQSYGDHRHPQPPLPSSYRISSAEMSRGQGSSQELRISSTEMTTCALGLSSDSCNRHMMSSDCWRSGLNFNDAAAPDLQLCSSKTWNDYNSTPGYIVQQQHPQQQQQQKKHQQQQQQIKPVSRRRMERTRPHSLHNTSIPGTNHSDLFLPRRFKGDELTGMRRTSHKELFATKRCRHPATKQQRTRPEVTDDNSRSTTTTTAIVLAATATTSTPVTRKPAAATKETVALATPVLSAAVSVATITTTTAEIPAAAGAVAELASECVNGEDAPRTTTKNNKNKRNSQKRTVLDKRGREILESWYYSWRGHPYPSEETVEALARAVRIKPQQVTKWFANRRRREGNTKTKAEIARFQRQQKLTNSRLRQLQHQLL